jgi:hypothetical protein
MEETASHHKTLNQFGSFISYSPPVFASRNEGHSGERIMQKMTLESGTLLCPSAVEMQGKTDYTKARKPLTESIPLVLETGTGLSACFGLLQYAQALLVLTSQLPSIRFSPFLPVFFELDFC